VQLKNTIASVQSTLLYSDTFGPARFCQN